MTRPLNAEEQKYIADALTMARCSKTDQERRDAIELVYRLGYQQGQIDYMREQIKEAA